MHDPHQERDGRERLFDETLGVGSLAFCDMSFPVEHGRPDKPLVLLPRVYLLGIYISECHRFFCLFRRFGGRVNSVCAVA